MMLRSKGMSLASLALLLLASCWAALDERAELDRHVGLGQAAGLRLEVGDGLAAITGFEAGAITLWSQAPALQMVLDASSASVEPWTLTVGNAMPGSSLQGTLEDGTPVDVAAGPADGACPTRQSWAFRLAPGRRGTLTLSPPPTAGVEPVRFAVINDPHGAGRIRQYIPALNADPHLAFALSSGDVSGGASSEGMFEVQQTLCELGVPFYATPGNTESGGAAWHQVFGRQSFHFEFRGVAFSFADSSSASLAPEVYDLLDGWMASSRAMPHIFVSHVPPLDPLGSRNGGFRSRNEAGKLLAHLARGGVDLLVLGHLHNFHQLDEGGIPTVICGGGHSVQPYVVVDVEPNSGTISVARVSSPLLGE